MRLQERRTKTRTPDKGNTRRGNTENQRKIQQLQEENEALKRQLLESKVEKTIFKTVSQLPDPDAQSEAFLERIDKYRGERSIEEYERYLNEELDKFLSDLDRELSPEEIFGERTAQFMGDVLRD
jgi:Fe-S cluster biosynthesis and repair protein YggX